MQPKLAILMAVVMTLHYSTAAPSAYDGSMLPRPSPINPDIPMDPKPAETITLITDPKEIAKFKREIGVEASTVHITAPTTVAPTHPYPLHQPEQTDEHNERLQHHRQKRDSNTDTKSTVENPSKKSTSPVNNQKSAVTSSTVGPPKRKLKRPTSSTSTKAPGSSAASASQVKQRQKREDNVDTVPLIDRNQHKQPLSTLTREVPMTANHESREGHESTSISASNAEQQSTIRPQTLPFFFSESEKNEQTHKESKRDIPVPLVPKYHHPEETPETPDKHETKSESKEIGNPSTDKPTVHSAPTETFSTHHNSESSLERKSEKRTATESSDVVQVEDLSEHHQQQQATSSTTASSIFRHRPVPVAELFAKGKPTESTDKTHHEAN